jgi:hypothetical protein
MSSAPGRIVAVTPGGGWQRRQGVTWESAVAWAYDDEGSIWPVMPSDEGPTLIIDYSEAQWRQVPEEHPDDVDGALDVEPAAHMMSENPYRMPAGGVTNLDRHRGPGPHRLRPCPPGRPGTTVEPVGGPERPPRGHA